MIENALDCLGMSKPCNDQENVEPNVQQGDDLLRAAHLKKRRSNPKIQGEKELGLIN